MCGNVIRGRTDPSHPFFTRCGSFWTNCTTHLLASTTEDDRQSRTRNRCNAEGYESVALVPLRSNGTTVGLLQMNDHRPDLFTSEFIAFCERLGASVAVALERKQADARLRAALADLERYNTELNAFAYSVSHDLRAPLRAIDGYSQALQEDCGDLLNAEGRDHLGEVRKGTRHMGRLLDGLLRLCRVSQAEMETRPVDLSALATEIAHELGRSQPEREVEFVLAPGLTVSGDAELLRAALQNLMSNAWKFTARQSHARIEFGVTHTEGGATYFVRDNGAGFDMKRADRLFGAFQRLHRQADYPGTGVGLATVKRTIHRHGGRVWAEASVGRGATFHFTLPAANASAVSRSPSNSDPRAPH
jgi:light-regulated signal transduction histidine kinase (bacteriophytochrome)